MEELNEKKEKKEQGNEERTRVKLCLNNIVKWFYKYKFSKDPKEKESIKGDVDLIIKFGSPFSMMSAGYFLSCMREINDDSVWEEAGSSLHIDLTNCNMNVIPERTFDGFQSLKSVKLPSCLEKIDESAFEGCENLTSIDFTLCDKLKVIGEGAFSGCCALEEVFLPESLEMIDASAFHDCVALKTMTVPKSVKSIGEGAFLGCYALESVFLPEGLRVIEEDLFNECDKLCKLSLPSSIEYIFGSAFNNCVSLEEIDFKKVHEWIKKDSEEQPVTLSHVTESSSPTILDLSRCQWYRSVSRKRNDIKKEGDFVTFMDARKYVLSLGDASCGIYTVRISSKEKYDNDFWSFIDALKCLYGMNPFLRIFLDLSGCSSGLIEGTSFFNCSSLEGILLPEGMKSIGVRMFGSCKNLKSIEIPKSVERIGWIAFCECFSLEKVVLPEGLKSIGFYTFSECNSLKTIEIPEGVKSIGKMSFLGCTSLEKVVLPESIDIIDRCVFNNFTEIVFKKPWRGCMWKGDKTEYVLQHIGEGSDCDMSVEDFCRQGWNSIRLLEKQKEIKEGRKNIVLL